MSLCFAVAQIQCQDPALNGLIICFLQALMGALSKSAAGLPVLPQLFDPDRWLLWLGVLFVLSVYFFPAGIVGKLAARK